MIRPRGGDFCYSLEEFNVVLRDVIACKSIGVDGIVIGMLKKDYSLDYEKLNIVKNIVNGEFAITFHRAFDVCDDPYKAIDTIISLGFNRILTSGQADSALNGKNNLIDYVNYVNNKISIIGAAGININNVESIIKDCHVHGVHAGSSLYVQYTNSVNVNDNNINIGLSSNKYNSSEVYDRVDSSLVADYYCKCMAIWSHSSIKYEQYIDDTTTLSNNITEESNESTYDADIKKQDSNSSLYIDANEINNTYISRQVSPSAISVDESYVNISTEK